MEAPSAAIPRARVLIPILILIALLRIWLGFQPGYPPDLITYEVWAVVAGTHGIHTIYDPMSSVEAPAVPGGTNWAFGNYDYPPLYAYLLAPVGAIYGRLQPDAIQHVTDSLALRFLVKIPPLVFDVLMAVLIAGIAHRYRLWRGRRSWLGWGAAIFYLIQPAVLFDSGYWGQPDVIYIFFVLLSLTLILRGRTGWGWVAAALACLMKPLAVPFMPLLFLATVLRAGWKKFFLGAGCAAGTVVLVFLPFVLGGRSSLVFHRLTSDLDLMPLTSINAHNLWWLLGPWKPAQTPWIGPITKTQVGLALFAAAYAYVLWRLWRIERGGVANRPTSDASGEMERWYVAGAAIAFSFFFFSTYMHENHLFAAIPFLVVLAAKGKEWTALAVLVGLACFVNMADHDLILGRILFAGRRPVSIAMTGTTAVRMPQAMVTIATVNSVVMTGLYASFAWAAVRSLDSRRTVHSGKGRTPA